jgi:hypothetical protein
MSSSLKLTICSDSQVVMPGMRFPYNSECIIPQSGLMIGLSPAKQKMYGYHSQAVVPFMEALTIKASDLGLPIDVLWVVDSSDTFGTQNCDCSSCNDSIQTEQEVKKFQRFFQDLVTLQADCGTGQMTSAQNRWSTPLFSIDLETSRKLWQLYACLATFSRQNGHAMVSTITGSTLSISGKAPEGIKLPVAPESLIMPWQAA